MNPRNGSSRLGNGTTNPPNRPRTRRVQDASNNVVAVSRGNDTATEVTNRGSGSSTPRGGRRWWRQCGEPDPPADVAQAARVLRRKTNPKIPELPRSCSVCSSKFYCWRELFAHMKTHPEMESQCMREISPPLDSPVEGEAHDHGSSSDGRELASILHMSPSANKDHGDRNAALAAASPGAGASGSAAHASPRRPGLGFDFDLNKPPPKEDNDDDEDGLDLKKLPPEAAERGGQ